MGLFKPGWMNENEEKALRAIAEEEDQKQLAKAAIKAPCYSAKDAAIKKLSDQDLLIDIVKNTGDSPVRDDAIRKTKDQNTLIDVVKNDKSKYSRAAAAWNITDQGVLVDIIKNEESENVRYAATSNITDKNILMDIAKNDKSKSVCLVAIERLKDQKLLADFIIKNIDNSNIYDLCHRAFLALKDQQLLAEIIVKCKTGYKIVRLAMQKISDPEIRSNVIEKTCAKNKHDYEAVGLGYEEYQDGDGDIRTRRVGQSYRCARCGKEKTE